MKPTKNTIYCYGCQRTKMPYETKSKSDNFIKHLCSVPKRNFKKTGSTGI